MYGWIKIHRKILDWEWYSDSVTKDVFIHLLIVVNHKDKMWQGQRVKAGSTITSIKKLSHSLGFSLQQIRTALNKLEMTGEITKESTNKYTLISVVNYKFYQSSDCENNIENNNQLNNVSINNQQTNNKQLTTNNNYNNDNNVNNEEEVSVCFANINRLRKDYPYADWDNYEKEDFDLQHSTLKSAQGVVMMSPVQEDLLMYHFASIEIVDEYVGKLADFILEKDANVKNHFSTIIKWYNEDRRINAVKSLGTSFDEQVC